MLMEFANEVFLFRPFVLLCKHWHNQDVDAKKIKSFYIELLCKDIIVETRAETIPALFRDFLERLATGRGTTLRNPNRYMMGNVALPREVEDAIAFYAEESRRKLHRFIRPGNTTSCPCCGVQRFRDHTGAIQHLESGACPRCHGKQHARKVVYDFVRNSEHTQHLLNHMLTDGPSGCVDTSADDLYECPHCRWTFKQLSALADHMTKKHGRSNPIRLALFN